MGLKIEKVLKMIISIMSTKLTVNRVKSSPDLLRINSSESNTMTLIGNLDLGNLNDILSYLATPIYKSWKVFDNLLLDHVGLPDVLVIAVHQVNLLGWVGQGDFSETFFSTFLLETWFGIGLDNKRLFFILIFF